MNQCSGSQPMFCEPHATPKHPLCGSRQSFIKPLIFCATDFAIKQNMSIDCC